MNISNPLSLEGPEKGCYLVIVALRSGPGPISRKTQLILPISLRICYRYHISKYLQLQLLF